MVSIKKCFAAVACTVIFGAVAAAANADTITLKGICRDFRTSDANGPFNPDFISRGSSEGGDGGDDHEGGDNGNGNNNDKNSISGDDHSKSGDDKGIVSLKLGADGTPEYGNNPKGTRTTHSATSFKQWFHPTADYNLRKDTGFDFVSGTGSNSGLYTYDNQQFFPLDGAIYGNDDTDHNSGFTYEGHANFTYNGGETLTLTGNLDAWLYINGILVIDQGGVHTSETTTIKLDALAAQLGIKKGGSYKFDLFLVNRTKNSSKIHIETTIKLNPVAPKVEPANPSPKVMKLAVSPNYVRENYHTQGKLILDHIPDANTKISIVSDSPKVAWVDNLITVEKGNLTADFDVITGPVNGNTVVNLITLLENRKYSTTFTVRSIELFALDLLPGDAFTGGITGTMTFTLEAAAPAGGKTIYLSSDRPDLVGLPASIKIEAGKTKGVVTFPTAKVAGKTVVTIHLLCGDRISRGLLTLTK